MCNSSRFKAVVALLASPLLAWAVPGLAQQSSCLNDSLKKVCVELISQPGSVVQASKLGNDQDTFVYYTAKVRGITLPSSSRNAEVSFTLSPAVAIVEFTDTGGGVCSVSGASLTCRYDKLSATSPTVITMTTKAPEFAGPSTPATLVNSGVFGWNGRTATVSKTLTVSTSGGYSWVPPNTSVTLTTAPENPDPSQQTTPGTPLFAKMVIPGKPVGFQAYLAINNDTGEDIALSCSGGLFFSGNSDGGPYVCRDIGSPFDAGHGRRWVEAAIDEDVAGPFTATPVQITVIWDDTIVPPTQLPPTLATPNGTPALAMFYRAHQEGGEQHPIRAFAKPCGSNQPPCLSAVQNYSTNDWTATLQTTDLNNEGEEADPLLPPLLGALVDVLNGILQLAHAGFIDDKIIIK